MAGWPAARWCRGGARGHSRTRRRRRPTIGPAELKRLLDAGEAAIVDLAPSIAYEAGHIPGAWFAVRARLPGSLDRVPRRPVLVLTSPDARAGKACGGRAGGLRLPPVRVLDGGTDGVARRRVAARHRPRGDGRHPRRLLAPALRPYAREGARERYLKWEIELVHQIEREGDVGFRVPEASP